MGVLYFTQHQIFVGAYFVPQKRGICRHQHMINIFSSFQETRHTHFALREIQKNIPVTNFSSETGSYRWQKGRNIFQLQTSFIKKQTLSLRCHFDGNNEFRNEFFGLRLKYSNMDKTGTECNFFTHLEVQLFFPLGLACQEVEERLILDYFTRVFK